MTAQLVRFVAVFTLVLTAAGCDPPTIGNRTPLASYPAGDGAIAVTADVALNGTELVSMEVVIEGATLPMSVTPGMPNTYVARYRPGPCALNVPYSLVLKYRQRDATGSSSTISQVNTNGILAVLGVVPASTCPAGTGRVISVGNGTDDATALCTGGTCSLRGAIITANASPGHDQIRLNARYNLTVTGVETVDTPDPSFGDLDITEAVTIVGTVPFVVIDGQQRSRIFDIHVPPGAGTVLVANLTLRNGLEHGHPGGAIYNRGSLSMDRVTITDNHLDATEGSSCAADYSVRICNRGGAIFNEGGLRIVDSTIRRNGACPASGDGTPRCSSLTGHAGAIANFGANAGTIIERSLIVENYARFFGGIQNYGGRVTITNSTLAGNHGSGAGTIVSNEVSPPALLGPAVLLRNVTVWNGGSPVFSSESGYNDRGIFRMASTIVSADSSFEYLCRGPIASDDHNHIGPFSSGSMPPDPLRSCTYAPAAGDYLGTFVLDSLRPRGGPTETMGIFPVRPDPPRVRHQLVDAGGPICPAVNQRGRPRPVAGLAGGAATCDPGAFEFDPATD